MSPKLDKWLRWMATIHDEIQQLVLDADTFWAVQSIIRANQNIQKPNPFFRYLGNTYVSHALAGVRRQVKRHKDSVCFGRLLDEIAQSPAELSRNHFCSLYSRTNTQRCAERDFAKYADASGEHVCPQMVADDRAELQSATDACEEFADKRIAHRDKRDPKVVPTFGELDECIRLLDRKYVKYHLLFYAEGMDTLMGTYQYNWKTIFREAWLVE